MWTTRPNLEAFDALRGSKTQAAFAAELQLDQSTLSRALSPNPRGTAGPRLVAHVLHFYPNEFSNLFDVVEVAP